MTDTEREMLEFAAKAAGIELHDRNFFTDDSGLTQKIRGGVICWNPFRSDGDALRLAVKLNMTCRFYFGNSVAQAAIPGGPSVYEDVTDTMDPNDGARHAITRAAAEIGKAMP